MRLLLCAAVCHVSALALKVAAPDGFARVGVARLEARGLEFVQSLELADAVVVRSATTVDAAWLERFPRVRVVARAGVGLDNVDLEACRDRGVGVATTPTASTAAVAELTIAHVLNALRRLPQADAAVRAGAFAEFKRDAGGREARGKTIGVLGYGAIGRRVGHVAECLGMRVIHSSGSPERLFAEADVVSVHLPLVEDTANSVDYELLASCGKRGVHLVNAARGGIVVERDVLRALDDGHLASYSTDVFESEPPGADSPLLAANHPNVFFSPHIGAATPEAQDRVALGVADALIALLLTDDDDSSRSGDASSTSDDDEASWRLVLPCSRRRSADDAV